MRGACRRSAVGVLYIPEDAPVTIATFPVLILCCGSTRVPLAMFVKDRGGCGGMGETSVQLTRVGKFNGNCEGGCARVSGRRVMSSASSSAPLLPPIRGWLL